VDFVLREVIPGVGYVAEVDAGIANEGWIRKNMMTVRAMEILGRGSALAGAAFLHPIVMSCDGDESVLLAIEFAARAAGAVPPSRFIAFMVQNIRGEVSRMLLSDWVRTQCKRA
jgi:hypothetical protein